MTPYYSSGAAPLYYNNSNIDIDQTNCISCQTPTLYLDFSQGDTVCTSCGLVHSQKYQSIAAEWRDYSAFDPDNSSFGNANMTARAGNSLVDESRWAGGLEPTSLGRVYNPTGSTGYNSPELQGYRRKLTRMKRVVDKWVEKEFERHVEEGKVALKVKEKIREKRELEKNGQDNDKDCDLDGDSEDWTGLSTNEHEELAKQRAEEMNMAKELLVSEKWSLDRALLLNGESHEIPSRYTSFNAMRGERPKDVQYEREKLMKRLDSKQQNASADLYRAYKILQQALNKLDLGGNMSFTSEVMTIICQFVELKNGFKINGVVPKNAVVKSKDKNGRNRDVEALMQQEQQNEYNKQRQMAALSSAIVYLECKKSRLGRSVVEICASFEVPTNFTHQKLRIEPFIKQKHLSRAINSIKALLPDYIKSVASSAAKTAANVQGTTSSLSLLHSNNDQTVDQINRLSNKLKISSTASKAVTKLVLYCQEKNLCNFSGTREIQFTIASIIYLVCDAGTTMQRLSKTALEKKEKNERVEVKRAEDTAVQVEQGASVPIPGTNVKLSPKLEPAPKKRKHIRPSGSSSGNRKRQKIGIKQEPYPCNPVVSNNDFVLEPLEKVDLNSVKKDATIESNVKNEMNASLSMTTSSSSDSNMNIEPKASVPIMQSYYQWSLEKSWFLSMHQIIQSCNCKAGGGIFDFYRKQIYPKRKILLDVLQSTACHDVVGTRSPGGDTFNGYGKMNVLLSNIASVAPLMTVAKQ